MPCYQFDRPVEALFFDGSVDGLKTRITSAPEYVLAHTEEDRNPEVYERRSSSIPPIHYVWVAYAIAVKSPKWAIDHITPLET